MNVLTTIGKGDLVAINGQIAQIEQYCEGFVIYQLRSQKKAVPECMDMTLFDAGIKDGSIRKVEASKAIHLCELTSPEDITKYNFLSTALEKIELSSSPCSTKTRNAAIEFSTAMYHLPSNYMSESTLYRAYKKYVANGRILASLFATGNKSGRPKKLTGFSLDYLNEIIYEEFLQLNGPSILQVFIAYQNRAKAYREKLPTEEQSNFEVVGKSKFYDYIAELDPVEVVRAREGEDAARRKALVMDKKYKVDHPLQRVELDAVHLNLGLIDRVRGGYLGKVIVYFAIDVNTRAIVGYVVAYGVNPSEQTSAVLTLIDHIVEKNAESDFALNKWPLSGPPVDVVVDAGSAFNNENVRNYVHRLGANLIVTQTGSPWKKPFIERFNRTFREQLVKKIPGYIGKRTDGRNIDKSLKDLSCVEVDDFVELVETYILDVYHQNPHRGLGGLTPQQAVERSNYADFIKFPVNLNEVKLTGGGRKERTIQRYGVTINNIEYNSRLLQQLRGRLEQQADKLKKRVSLNYRSTDVSKISVIDPFTGKEFEVPSKLYSYPITLAEHKAAKIEEVDRDTSGETTYKTIGADNVIILKCRKTQAAKAREKQREKSAKRPEKKAYEGGKVSQDDLEQVVNSGEGRLQESQLRQRGNITDDKVVTRRKIKSSTSELAS